MGAIFFFSRGNMSLMLILLDNYFWSPQMFRIRWLILCSSRPPVILLGYTCLCKIGLLSLLWSSLSSQFDHDWPLSFRAPPFRGCFPNLQPSSSLSSLSIFSHTQLFKLTTTLCLCSRFLSNSCCASFRADISSTTMLNIVQLDSRQSYCGFRRMLILSALFLAYFFLAASFSRHFSMAEMACFCCSAILSSASFWLLSSLRCSSSAVFFTWEWLALVSRISIHSALSI